MSLGNLSLLQIIPQNFILNMCCMLELFFSFWH